MDIRKVIVVATRGPTEPLSGGMATAVALACENFNNVTWYAVENAEGHAVQFNTKSGACESCPSNTDAMTLKHVAGMEVKTLQVNAGIWDSHYNKFSNQIFWPLLHGHMHRVSALETTDRFGNDFVNDRIAQAIARDLDTDCQTPIWIHDYHHFALPAFLRKHGVKNPIIFFSHVPMPDPEEVKTLPIEQQGNLISTLQGLLYCDAAIFQTGETARRAMTLLGVPDAPKLGFYEKTRIVLPVGSQTREVQFGHYPISINTPAIMATASQGALVSDLGRKINDNMVAENIFINFERCDYSKGIIQRLLAFETLLEKHPDLRGKAQIVIGAEPTRKDIDEYQLYARQVNEISKRINANTAYQCAGKPPVLLLYQNVVHDDVLTLMRNLKPDQRKIVTITPYTDGMNLVSKEGVAVQNPENAGVVLLSSGAGSAAELSLDGLGAVMYDASAKEMDPEGHYHSSMAPCDNSVDAIYHAMLEAVRMPQEEANARCRAMQERVKTHDQNLWANSHRALFEEIVEERRQALAPKAHAAAPRHDDPDIWSKGYLEEPQQLQPC